MATPKSVVIGNYRVIEKIAEGSIGTTYKGEHVTLGMPVCIKHCNKIAPEYEEILINETRAMWDLRHYAMPAVRDLVRVKDGSLALVMSYIPGPTLQKLIEKVGALDPEHVAWIAERILNALMYLHYHGVPHGDNNPKNIILQLKTHGVVIVDFGLAQIKPTFDDKSRGYTPLYAPPEQIAGLTLLPESDLYSLGMTMIFALSGGIEAVKRKEVPTNTPEPLARFIRRLIVRDVSHRPKWDDEDLCDTIQAIRVEAFGRHHSGMKPLPGFEDFEKEEK
jgi:serine/threonine protein kinase